jgi:hypothetical protein
MEVANPHKRTSLLNTAIKKFYKNFSLEVRSQRINVLSRLNISFIYKWSRLKSGKYICSTFFPNFPEKNVYRMETV